MSQFDILGKKFIFVSIWYPWKNCEVKVILDLMSEKNMQRHFRHNLNITVPKIRRISLRIEIKNDTLEMNKHFD